jgi:hypothetical protein
MPRAKAESTEPRECAMGRCTAVSPRYRGGRNSATWASPPAIHAITSIAGT